MRMLRASLVAVSVVVSLALVTGCRSSPEPQAARSPAGPSAPSPSAQAEAAHRPGTWPGKAGDGTPLVAGPGHALALFSAGCFWGVEARFRQVTGVVATAVGYTGGHTQHPTYAEVCTHTTGHAETVLVEFDPAKVSYEQLLEVFWAGHDPTTLDRQGPDEGDQYRSAIFTFSAEQDAEARASLARHQKRLVHKIVTRIEPQAPFYLAEDYHQQYHEKTGSKACPTGHALELGGI